MIGIIFLELSNPKSISNGLFRNTSFGRIKRSQQIKNQMFGNTLFNLLIEISINWNFINFWFS